MPVFVCPVPGRTAISGRAEGLRNPVRPPEPKHPWRVGQGELLVRRDKAVNADGFAYIYRHQVLAELNGTGIALSDKGEDRGRWRVVM